ncbi:MAG: NAD-dependent deacylase [Planctomycetota bacterium]
MPHADLLRALRSAQHVFILTGAGTSAESNLPTFRDPGPHRGLWDNHRPEDLASPDAFAAHPARVQSWYGHRRRAALAAQPNPAHHAIAQLAQHVPKLTLVTQNVDGLHQRAGSKGVLELHGSLHRWHCVNTGEPVDDATLDAQLPQTPDDPPLRSPSGTGYVRPGVVWFGEGLPTDVLAKAEAAARTADVALSIGTSALVYPAAALPLLAKEAGAYTAEINPTPSAIAHQLDAAITQPAGVAMSELLRTLTAGINPDGV